MSIVAIVQARTSSSRLPGKVLMELNQEAMILFQLKRISKSERIDQLVLATSTDSSDDDLANQVTTAGFKVYRGDLEDVLERYRACAKHFNATTVIRLTGDCPLTDPKLIDELVDEFFHKDIDYIANNADANQLSVPDGFDVEIFRAKLLETAAKEAKLNSEREHVTPWFRSKKAKLKWEHFKHSPMRPYYRVTVDELKDLEVIRSIVSSLEPFKKNFCIDDVIEFLENNPKIASHNLATMRNEGLLKSKNADQTEKNNKETGQNLWSKAKKLIPGGNMLLSKRSEMFLPDHWPAYFSRAKGCRVWDLDNNELIDMSIMGIGTNLLGYGHPEVDSAVAATIASGNMCTLNCPEEVKLAERLIELHPWADMVRFARSGGEANSIAIRIARAATGREAVAICGYHGWHDWYMATNLQNDSNLEEHLLPGLNPNGVPRSLAGTTIPFSYNRLDQLEKIVSENNLAAVKMEVQRSTPPKPGFLEGIRELCTQKGIVLIFDECTSGFRETLGGLHLKYGIEPDMAMFGKAMGNGYAITSVIGIRDVMEAAQKTFISSTFWTERIGPSAGLKSIEVMEQEKSWEKVTKLGLQIKEIWQSLADENQLTISQTGLPALAGFSFKSENSIKYKTLITQEMLKKGFLASTSFYASIAHTQETIEAYKDALSTVFNLIGDCEHGQNVDELLQGPVCHSGFQRLN